MIARLINRHIPILIMIGSSGSIFIANLIAKKSLPPELYEQFSYTITIATILSSLALLGTEQLIIRFSQHGEKIEIPSNVIKTIAITITISALALPTTINTVLNGGISKITISSMSLAIGLSLIACNLQRLQEQFTKSQLTLGAWRAVTLATVLAITYSNLKLNFEQTITILMFFISAISLAQIIHEAKKFKITKPKIGIISTTLAFSLSLGLMTILNGFDRVLAENTGDSKLFSDFVHLSMFLIFPFNIISSYIGLKEAIYFKKEFNKKIFIKKLLNSAFTSALAYAAIATATYTLKDTLEVKLSVETIISCLILTTIKTTYSIASSAMGAIGSAKKIWYSNILSGAAIIPIYALSSAHASLLSIEKIIWVFALLWGVRTAIFVFFLRKNHA